MMTDGTMSRGDARVYLYNDWVGTFLRRGGRAHGIVVHGIKVGITTEVLMNLDEQYRGVLLPFAGGRECAARSHEGAGVDGRRRYDGMRGK